MLLKDFLRDGEKALESLYPAAEARSIMLMLCEAIVGTKSYTHIIEPSFTIPHKDESTLLEALRRLSEGEPVQYVIGRTDFCGNSFKVTPDTHVSNQLLNISRPTVLIPYLVIKDYLDHDSFWIDLESVSEGVAVVIDKRDISEQDDDPLFKQILW